MSVPAVLGLISFTIGAISVVFFIHFVWSLEEDEELYISNNFLVLNAFVILYFFIEKMFWITGR